MRHQTRPFTVEIKKAVRKSAPLHFSLDEPSPDELPVRDIHDDGPREALLLAERVFGRSTPILPPVEAKDPQEIFRPATKMTDVAAAAAEPPPSKPRILPSLVPANPLEEAEALRKAATTRAKRERKKQPVSEAKSVSARPNADEPAPLPNTVVERFEPRPASPRSARSRENSETLPLGQRWKRRLPRFCRARG